MKRIEGKYIAGFVFVVLAVLFWFVYSVIQLQEAVIETPEPPVTNNARELRIFLEEHQCDSSYLGVYEVENYGKMELFCENGEFFGEIPDVFSISLTEKKQKGWFLSVFCIYDDCYAHPVTIIDGMMQDVYGWYVSAEVVK
jgi:hypothetical protein